MTERNTGSLNLIEQAVLNRISQGEIKGKIHQLAMPYKELMAYYRCAMMQVETKFNVLDEELSLQYDRNPIETIKTLSLIHICCGHAKHGGHHQRKTHDDDQDSVLDQSFCESFHICLLYTSRCV